MCWVGHEYHSIYIQKLKDGECKVCSSLHTTLEDLLREGEGLVPALAAKLLSHAQMSQDKCTECLKGLLSSSEEEVQNMVRSHGHLVA